MTIWKSVKTIILIFLLINSVTAFPSSEWQAEELFTQIAELRTKNQALQKELDELKEEVAILKQVVSKSENPMIDAKEMLENNPILGDKNAPLVIIEFTDFQCPFCKKYDLTTFSKLKEGYIDTGKIQYVVRDFPLSFHSHAKLAAIAAKCAGEQKNYWPMRHKIFEHQRDLSKEKLIGFADSLKLKNQAFVKCLDDPKQTDEVEKDMAYADRIGIQSTPSFILARKESGRLLDIKVVSGAQSYRRFSQLLDAFLAKQ